MSNLIQVSIPIRVLIVEDSAADAELMLGSLSGHGFAPQGERVETEAAYLAALDAAPDVILADYRLPHFSGPRALELLNARAIDIPFIVVSGVINDVEAANLIKAGACDFLLKDRMARLGPAVTLALEFKRARDEQRRIEASLAEKEEHFRATFEQAGVGMGLRDIDPRKPRWLRVNQKLCDIFGYTHEELLELSSVDITVPEERQIAIEYNEKLVRGEISTYSREKRYVRKDGQIIWVNLTLAPVYGQDGRQTHVISVIEDITERKQTEERLRKVDRVRRIMAECNRVMVHAEDETRLLQDMCKTAVESGGYRMAWVGYAEHDERKSVRPIAQAGFDEGYLEAARISWDDTERGRGPSGRAIRLGRTYVVRNALTDPNFTPWRDNAVAHGYRSHIALPLASQGAAFGVLSLYATEVDAFDTDEVALLESFAADLAYGIVILRTRIEHARAEESRAQLAAIVENANDAIASRALDGTITSWNTAAERLFGYAAAEAIGQNIFALLIPPDQKQLMEQTRASLAQGGAVIDLEAVRLAKDGRRIDVSMTHSLLKDKHGTTVGASLIFRDITERKLQEKKIVRLSRIHAVLSGINSLIVRVRDRQELFKEACRIAVEHGGFRLAWIGMVDEQRHEISPLVWAGHNDGFLSGLRLSIRADVPEKFGIAGRAVHDKKPVVVNDIADDSRTLHKKKLLQHGFRSIVGLPLLIEGEAIGAFVLYGTETGVFDKEEMKLLTELAGDISFALDHIARQEKLDKLARIRAVSGEINAAIVRISEREALLKETCRIAAEQGRFELAWIGSLDAEKQEVRPVAWAGFSPDAAHSVSWATINAAKGTLGEAIRTQRPAINNDIDASVKGGGLRQEAIEKDCFSTVSMPLVVGGKVVALFGLFAPGRGFFDADELALLNEMAADVSFALDSIAKEEKLNYLAYYDDLTGLPNRALFDDRMTQVLRAASHEKSKTALVLIDLERFRHFNESLGRSAADELLKLVAQRLQSGIFDRDSLARVQADAFAGLFPDIKDEADIARIIEEKVIACLSQPFTISGQELRVSAKIGVALFPGDALAPDALYSAADAALNQAKKSSDRYLFYAPRMNAQVAKRLKLENKLQRALERNEFVLYYQPKVAFITGRVAGLEALMRWNDPDTGLVPPMQFIPLLEETGMIVEVGAWAMKQAVSQSAAWRAAGIEPPPIAVNVSQVQLKRNDFVASVEKAIAGTPGHGLEIEITESMIMEDIETSIAKLKAVRALGVGISIDDFGTGHSSLRYLTQLPINGLKIDRAFIEHLATNSDDAAIVSTVISLGHNLRLKVIAEGVETVEQSRFLELLGCDEFQGYLFSKPVPAEQVPALLA